MPLRKGLMAQTRDGGRVEAEYGSKGLSSERHNGSARSQQMRASEEASPRVAVRYSVDCTRMKS